MTSARRIGAPDAKNRAVLLDAAEQLMLEEGYAAVTSRRVAERAALKPQLVHYYFRTMDELFLAAFRRRAEQGLEVQAMVLQAPQPLWALWRFSTDPAATAITMEFIALANHRKALKAEIAFYAERFREEQRKALTTILARYGRSAETPVQIPPAGVVGADDQRVPRPGDRAGARHVRRPQRNGRDRRELPPAYRGRSRGLTRRPAPSAHQLRSEQSTPFGPSLDFTTTPSTTSAQ